MIFVIFSTILAGICGLWKTNNGRDYLIRRALSIRGDLVTVPQNERGLKWKIQSLASLVLIYFFTYLLTYPLTRIGII